MKRIPLIVMLALSLMLIAAASSALTPAAAEATTAPAQTAAQSVDTIAVTGSGIVEAKPDTATLNTGVMTENKDAKAAASDNAKKMEDIIAALKKAGVKDADIKTVSYNIDPNYDYSTSKMQLIGYRVTNMVQVTLFDTSKVGEVLDAATSAGANQASSVQFGFKDPTAMYQTALTKAMDNAKTVATTLAKAAGRELNVVVQVTEGATYSPYQAYNMDYARNAVMAASGSSTPIASGSSSVTATVNVVYSLK